MKNNTEFPSVRPGTCANKTGKGVEPRELEKKSTGLTAHRFIYEEKYLL